MRVHTSIPWGKSVHKTHVVPSIVIDAFVTRRHYGLKRLHVFKPCTINLSFCARPVAVPYGPSIGNDCHCCAERKMIRSLMLQASRRGVGAANFPSWIHRKYGDFVVTRVRTDGGHGTSLPCVICRKALDRLSIQWRAHVGAQWFRSTDQNVPPSRPTSKQRVKLGFL